MNRLFLRIATVAALALPLTSGPARAQVKVLAGTSATVDARGVAVDASGNTYVAGRFMGTVDFDRDNTVVGDTRTSNGNYDVFVARYNSAGVLQFVKTFGTTGNDPGYAVATDGLGNVYATGAFTNVNAGSIDFDQDNIIAGDTKATTGTNQDAFVVKYNSAGELQFVKVYGGTGTDYGMGLAADGSGNVYVGGVFSNAANVDFDRDNVVSGDTKSTTGTTQDAYVAKYNSAGVLQFVKQIGGTGTDSASGMGVDGSGNVYATGYFTNGTVDFDRDNTVSGDTKSSTTQDAFVAKYNSAGVLQFVKQIGGTGLDSGQGALAIDSQGNVYSTGFIGPSSSGGVDFDPDNGSGGGIDTRASTGNLDAFLVKYSSTGVLQFVKSYGGATGNDIGFGVTVDGSDNVYTTGLFNGTRVDFDTDNDVTRDTLINSGSQDAYVAKYNSAGVLQFVKQIGGTGVEYGYGVAISSGGLLYVSGYTTSTSTDFDVVSAAAGEERSRVGTQDAYVATYDASGVLPVELVAFTASADGPSAHLRWTTQSETGNAGFSVETLRRGTWAEVAFVAGRGTTSERTNYAHTVDGLPAGIHHFRLRQIDLDGATSYSPTVEVSIGVDGALSLEVRGTSVRVAVRDAQAVRADLFNALGQHVATLFAGEAEAGQTQTLDLPSGLGAGVYLVRVTGRTVGATAPVVVR